MTYSNTPADYLPKPDRNTRAALDAFRSLFALYPDHYDSHAGYIAHMTRSLRRQRVLGLAGSFAYDLARHRQMVICRDLLAAHWAKVDAAIGAQGPSVNAALASMAAETAKAKTEVVA